MAALLASVAPLVKTSSDGLGIPPDVGLRIVLQGEIHSVAHENQVSVGGLGRHFQVLRENGAVNLSRVLQCIMNLQHAFQGWP